MSTHAKASAVIPLPIEKVWEQLRQFDFPKLFSTIDKVELHGGSPVTLGVVRTLKWKTGETVSQSLIELSDQNYRSSWELVAAEPPSEVTGAITTLTLHRITETNQTLARWETEFSSDVKNDIIKFEQRSYLENLKELRSALERIK
eukprot:TRINITY_DN3943_c0_g1_i1.p1 TRINITY_DN3943_c0_g1~~TRINITY_DN3943_c0_g1_i1.p1  ORF type:complete len:146 (-),score=35.26 TRINITY_DN3943_c0_g1_i1:718-1155(-)